MFIIWGSKNQREHLGEMSMKCPNCQTLRSFNVFEISSKFTLYYLPLFTYKRKQFAFCNSCGYISETPKGMEDKIRDRIKKTVPKPVDREKEKKALAQILRSDPNNEMAWLSMATLLSVSDQKRECYEKVLTLNPENVQAKNGLARLRSGGKQSSINPPKKIENQKMEEGGWGKFLSILFFVVVGLASIFFIYEISSMVGEKKDPHLWRSEKWGYEVTFPEDWGKIKRDNYTVKDSTMDVYCKSSQGSSTAIFVNENEESYTLSQIEEGVMRGYTDTKYGDAEKISGREYIKNGITYREFIFILGDSTHHYVVVEHNSYIYAISSGTHTDNYEKAKKDFDAIVASLNFFD